jgi:hypothetical protein
LPSARNEPDVVPIRGNQFRSHISDGRDKSGVFPAKARFNLLSDLLDPSIVPITTPVMDVADRAVSMLRRPTARKDDHMTDEIADGTAWRGPLYVGFPGNDRRATHSEALTDGRNEVRRFVNRAQIGNKWNVMEAIVARPRRALLRGLGGYIG